MVYGPASEVLALAALALGNRIRKDVVVRLQQIAGDYPYPVLLMLFEVQSDAGFCGWVKAPIFKNRQPSLDLVRDPSITPMTTEVLQTVVNEINAWYERRSVEAGR